MTDQVNILLVMDDIISLWWVCQVYFGTQHARVYLLAAWAGDNCANGMSWLVRKRALEQEGGLQAFTEYLAEDFFMSKAIWIRLGNLVFCC